MNLQGYVPSRIESAVNYKPKMLFPGELFQHLGHR